SLPVRECGLKQPRVQPRVGLRVSLPVRECGLKLRVQSFPIRIGVTPRAGVWIETGNGGPLSAANAVTPRAGVWIETVTPLDLAREINVTPRAGVWIETAAGSAAGWVAGVTPRAGVWIETTTCRQRRGIRLRHSPCGSVD